MERLKQEKQQNKTETQLWPKPKHWRLDIKEAKWSTLINLQVFNRRHINGLLFSLLFEYHFQSSELSDLISLLKAGFIITLPVPRKSSDFSRKLLAKRRVTQNG